MNTRRCLHIAERINVLLVRELMVAVDLQRMVSDALYARDVLLVCEAHVGSDMATLAGFFREAAAEQPSVKAEHADQADPADHPDDAEGAPTITPPDSATPARRAKLWFSPYRWLDRR